MKKPGKASDRQNPAAVGNYFNAIRHFDFRLLDAKNLQDRILRHRTRLSGGANEQCLRNDNGQRQAQGELGPFA
jgi:hypothetical protein